MPRGPIGPKGIDKWIGEAINLQPPVLRSEGYYISPTTGKLRQELCPRKQAELVLKGWQAIGLMADDKPKGPAAQGVRK